MPVFEPTPPPLAAPASVFVAVRFNRAAAGSKRFELLGNVRVESLHFSEGTTLPSAQFSYVLDDTDPTSPFPYLYEELWGLNATGRYVVRADDEVLVFEFTGDGSRYLRFDGFARLPQVDQGGGLAATFTAVGVHERLNDYPVQGAEYRDASTPEATGPGVVTDLPVWFNPAVNGKSYPNKTPDDADVGAGTDSAYPNFIEYRLTQDPAVTQTSPAWWTLGSFIRYLFEVHNASFDETGKLWVNDPVSPTGQTIDDYLKGVKPKDGKQFYDPTDSTTYDTEDIVIRSFDATGKTVLEAAAEQLGYNGFHLYLNTREDPADPGAPVNEVIIFRDDGRDGNAPKEVYYPPEGSSLTDGIPDFNGIGITRDQASAVNEVEVETSEVEYEVSVILEAGFRVAAADASAGTVGTFNKSALANASADTRNKYRVFVYDEAGLGHWDFTLPGYLVGTATSLDDVLGKPKPVPNDPSAPPVRKYATRLRPAEGSALISADTDGKPRKAELAVSRGYTGSSPGLYDKTRDTNSATDWQSLGDSGWRLLTDRLGIEITADSPEKWGLPKGANPQFAGDVLRVVTSLAAPAGANTRFWLRLTCVIKGDQGIEALAARRDACPSRFTVRRVIESKDHWRKQVVTKCSVYNGTTQDKVQRDDTARAQAQADSLRAAHEFPSVAGSVTIPWSSLAFGVGDLVSKISGRDVDLRSNAGGGQGEGPRYPAVVGVSVTCQDPQVTTLKLSDRRSEPEAANHGFGRST